MANNEATLKKIALTKVRVGNALMEYAKNLELLKDSIDWKDLTGYLTIWNEEFTSPAEAVDKEKQLFNIAILIGNLDIQLDILRSKNGWKKLDSAETVALPPELEQIKQTLAAV